MTFIFINLVAYMQATRLTLSINKRIFDWNQRFIMQDSWGTRFSPLTVLKLSGVLTSFFLKKKKLRVFFFRKVSNYMFWAFKKDLKLITRLRGRYVKLNRRRIHKILTDLNWQTRPLRWKKKNPKPKPKIRVKLRWLRNFLWFYGKQFNNLSRAGRFYRKIIVGKYSLLKVKSSVKLAMWRRRQKRYRRWVRKKKFTIRQQVSYQKFRFQKRVKKWDSFYISESYYFMRKLSLKFIIGSYLYRLKKFGARMKNLRNLMLKAGAVNRLLRARVKNKKFRNQKRKGIRLYFKRVRNNFHVTVTNNCGGVLLHFSSGAYLINSIEKKRNKKLRASYRHFENFLKFIVICLKRRKIRRIKYFIRPYGLKKKYIYSFIFTLIDRNITVEKIKNLSNFRHSLKEKKKKKRRL